MTVLWVFSFLVAVLWDCLFVACDVTRCSGVRLNPFEKVFFVKGFIESGWYFCG